MLVFVFSTPFTAINHLTPIPGPFLSPSKRTLAYWTYFGRKMWFFVRQCNKMFNKNSKKLNKNSNGYWQTREVEQFTEQNAYFYCFNQNKPFGHLWYRLQKT
tara:strand:- start:63359 stop:63664 length:306 start_codon:yes stop_codon:yes gene_type:complete